MKFYIRLVIIAAAIVLALWLMQEFDEKDAPAPAPVAATLTPADTRTPVPAPTAAVPQVPSQGILAKINRAAQAARVRISGVQSQNDWFIVTVQAPERNALGDFLDHARANGMRDVDLNRSDYKQFMSQGRPMHQDTYKMRF